MNSAVVFSKASDLWRTPPDLFAALDAEFDFGLDAAALPDGSDSLCLRWLFDALRADWTTIASGRAVYLNCPYSKVRAFIGKAALERRCGCTVVALVPARTDTRWWFAHVWDGTLHRPRPGVEVRFLPGRLKFSGSANSAPFPSVVLVFRPPPQE
jgi:site-specific DNA-methyltransferase (adenine-specific)